MDSKEQDGVNEQPTSAGELIEIAQPERGDAHYQRFDAPRAGTYWRTSRKIKERWDDRMSTRAIPKDTVLMLAEIEHADGAPHLYRFAPHPTWVEEERRGGWKLDTDRPTFHADDFYSYWMPEPDGEAVHQKELMAIVGEMDETRALLSQPPPDAPIAGLLNNAPTEAIGEPGQALVTTAAIENMLMRAERLKADAEARSTWITTHSNTLAKHGTVIAEFHQERAAAGIASAQQQLEGVAGLLKTVDNLRLYTGTGIEMIQLRAGESAAPDVRVTIYQDLLSLDEEAGLLLDQGGLDHTHTEEIAAAISDDRLLRQLIPAERGIVLVKFRREMKEFISTEGVEDSGQRAAAAAYNDQMSRESMRNRLLVRDGQNAYLLDIDSVLRGLETLMPHTAEQDGYFTEEPSWSREEPKRITRDHLAYSKAQRRQIGALDNYGKVLIALWGLRDRGELFAKSNIPVFGNWLDPDFQHAFMALVSFDTLIGIERPKFSQWQNDQNEYFASGAWVAIDLQQSFDADNAPGAFSQYRSFRGGGGHYDKFYRPDREDAPGGVLITRVRSDKSGEFVYVPCLYSGYNTKLSNTKRNIRLTLRDSKRLIGGVLVLDRAHASDLDYYLGSRKERRSYGAYLALFRAAREFVRERDAEEAPLRQYLIGAINAAEIEFDADTINSQVTDALAIARAARRGSVMPTTGTSAFTSYRQAALNALHASLTDNSARFTAVAAACAVQGRSPLRVVADGKDRWRIYMTQTSAELDVRLPDSGHVIRADLHFDKDGHALLSRPEHVGLRAVASEQILYDWPTCAEWLSKDLTFKRAWASAQDVLNLASVQSACLSDGSFDASRLYADARRYLVDDRSGQVARMRVGFAVGTGVRRGGSPCLIVATCDALHLAHSAGDESVKLSVRELVRSRYAYNKEARVADLDDPLDWSLLAISVDDVRGDDCEAYFKSPRGWRTTVCDFKDPSNAKSQGSARLTGLAPHGAALFPKLIAKTERAID